MMSLYKVMGDTDALFSCTKKILKITYFSEVCYTCPDCPVNDASSSVLCLPGRHVAIIGGVVFTSHMKEVFQLVKKLLDVGGGGLDVHMWRDHAWREQSPS
jgi:hypothetical protein